MGDRSAIEWTDATWNSMSDLFHENVPEEFIERVFAVMLASSRHTFQVLTKRPERMRDWVRRVTDDEDARKSMAYRVANLMEDGDAWWDSVVFGQNWPAPNVWLGVSIENRRFVDRADLLRLTPAAVRFISAEPLLGPLTPVTPYVMADEDGCYPWLIRDHVERLPEAGLDLADIDWVIAGGESGPDHRPARRSWIVALLDARVSPIAPLPPKASTTTTRGVRGSSSSSGVVGRRRLVAGSLTAGRGMRCRRAGEYGTCCLSGRMTPRPRLCGRRAGSARTTGSISPTVSLVGLHRTAGRWRFERG